MGMGDMRAQQAGQVAVSGMKKTGRCRSCKRNAVSELPNALLIDSRPPQGVGVVQRPMPLVGPEIPGPLGEPEDPLPMVPTPPEVGLALGMPGPEVPVVPPELPEDCAVPQLMPALPVCVEADALALPPLAEALAGGQSALLPVDAVPERVLPDAAEPLPLDVDMPVEPLLASPPLRVFGSTELPEPMVRELMPDVLLVGVCACARPAAASSAARLIEVMIFM